MSGVSTHGRLTGRLETSTTFGAHDHGCWAYTSEAQRAEVVTAWLADGLRIGQRALYVCDCPSGTGLAEVAGLDPEPLLDRGALEVVPASEVYDLTAPVDAERQLRTYAAAVERACADGFHGLRVAADITPLVIDPVRRAAHVHWEQVADRYTTSHPMAPLCLVDRRRVKGIDAVVSAHPLQGPERTVFALYGSGPQRAVLDGEVDAMADDTFTALLRGLPHGDAEIDASRLGFVDGHAAERLHDEMQARRAVGHELTLVAASPALRRVWSLCGFDPDLMR